MRAIWFAAVASAALLALAAAPVARADMFDVKGVEITKGETELAFALAPQEGHNVNSDNVRLHGEASFGYAFTSWFKAGGKLGFELGVTDNADATYGGVETQFLIVDPNKARFGFGWFTGFDFGFSDGYGETLTFGPVASLEIAKGLTVTVNPLFQKNWNPDQPGLDFNYAWQVKREINDTVALGIEGYGVIPDIGNAPGIDFQAHRLGPVLYLSHEMAGAGKSMKLGAAGADAKGGKVELQLGVLFGFTDATADTTGRAKLAFTW